MSWSLNVSGHVNAEPAVAKQVEEEVLRTVERCLAEIRAIEGSGVANAMFIGHHLGPRKIPVKAAAPEQVTVPQQ